MFDLGDSGPLGPKDKVYKGLVDPYLLLDGVLLRSLGFRVNMMADMPLHYLNLVIKEVLSLH